MTTHIVTNMENDVNCEECLRLLKKERADTKIWNEEPRAYKEFHKAKLKGNK